MWRMGGDTPVDVSASDVQKRLDDGWKILSPDEKTWDDRRKKYEGRPEALVLSALRTGTFGVSDYLVKKLGPKVLDMSEEEIAAELQGMQEFSDYYDLAGGIVGAVSPFGAVGLAGKATAGAVKAAGKGTFAQGVARAAAEGAVIGGGHTVSSGVIAGRVPTPEEFFGNMAKGAAAGGAVGLVGAGVGAAARYGFGKLKGRVGKLHGDEARALEIRKQNEALNLLIRSGERRDLSDAAKRVLADLEGQEATLLDRLSALREPKKRAFTPFHENPFPAAEAARRGAMQREAQLLDAVRKAEQRRLGALSPAEARAQEKIFADRLKTVRQRIRDERKAGWEAAGSDVRAARDQLRKNATELSRLEKTIEAERSRGLISAGQLGGTVGSIGGYLAGSNLAGAAVGGLVGRAGAKRAISWAGGRLASGWGKKVLGRAAKGTGPKTGRLADNWTKIEFIMNNRVLPALEGADKTRRAHLLHVISAHEFREIADEARSYDKEAAERSLLTSLQDANAGLDDATAIVSRNHRVNELIQEAAGPGPLTDRDKFQKYKQSPPSLEQRVRLTETVQTALAPQSFYLAAAEKMLTPTRVKVMAELHPDELNEFRDMVEEEVRLAVAAGREFSMRDEQQISMLLDHEEHRMGSLFTQEALAMMHSPLPQQQQKPSAPGAPPRTVSRSAESEQLTRRMGSGKMVSG
jgi:hypothetical protein